MLGACGRKQCAIWVLNRQARPPRILRGPGSCCFRAMQKRQMHFPERYQRTAWRLNNTEMKKCFGRGFKRPTRIMIWYWPRFPCRREIRCAWRLGYGPKQIVLVVATRWGASHREMAERLHTMGCTDAVNLDGGGSSTLVVNGMSVVPPAGRGQRPVGNALLVVQRRP